ncbi:MAG: DUF763 domain-containing protein [Spirochaetaceae bacterium]|nr:DUF763 domain-containing protein [Spirochaetaceae bacterium]
MIRSSGHADLPLHTGTVPKWLADRMMVMGSLIVESIIENRGVEEVLVRLSDPLWFQSFGAVMGMDWHSSGITTSVMYALKRGLNHRAKELGIYVCGGRGKYSRQTPDELLMIADKEGLDGDSLVKKSRLCAKVDNNAVQDGFQLYQHNFVVTRDGQWTVIQQGMNPATKTARRYHWSSSSLRSFVEEPHIAVVGENRGKILNLTDVKAREARSSILDLSCQNPDSVIKEIVLASKDVSTMQKEQLQMQSQINQVQGELFPELIKEKNWEISSSARNIIMPAHHDVQEQDVDLKRLGAVLATAYENQPENFEELLLTKGLGPRTLQSLTLVSEVIYGTPSRFTDPARFSFANGGKDGHPFPVPLKIYDESIRILQEGIEKSKLGYNDKSNCIKRLHQTALQIERNCSPLADFDAIMKYERNHSTEWAGRTE